MALRQAQLLSNLSRAVTLASVRCSHHGAGHAAVEKFDFGGDMPQHAKDEHYPKIGNRDIVGPGFNNMASYIDHPLNPCPAIRFKENTAEFVALRQKEKGDWKKLTLEEKKQLYRSSFAQTFVEMTANNNGDWKSIVAMIITAFGLTGWLLIYCRKFVVHQLPSTITPEWQEKQLQRMIIERQGRVEGISSQFDYEKNQWK